MAKRTPGRHDPSVRWQGRPYSVAEAGALAVQEQHRGNLAAAADLYRLILTRMPDCAEVHNNRGAILQLMERHEEALASYDKAITFKPDYANAHFNRGLTLKNLNRFADALASYDRAIALKPDHAEAHNSRGILLANHGKMPEAEKMFVKAVELKPDFAAPWFNLVNIRKYQDADNADASHIRQLLDQPGASPDDLDQLNFALGKIYDDCGRYDEAFACFQAANQIRNRQARYQADEIARVTDGIMKVFTKDTLAQPFAFASDNQSPLFIVGMPRSGTTLLASSLSNHRSIATAGELPTLSDFATRLPGLIESGRGDTPAAMQITPASAKRLIHDYERRLRRDTGSEARFVIDKNPLNFRNLGLISILFPKARIIHCTRQPMDACLSNYFQRFPLFMSYSFDLRNIGHFYAEYARLMAHWRQLPALNMIEISYEDMIFNTEKTARTMLDFLGLDWDERCLAPHTNPCPVETASQWQVRQPIYVHSVGRWQHYEEHLAPLKEVLVSAGEIPALRQ
jgi:tetratricopeptide (TPR) repeat protein